MKRKTTIKSSWRELLKPLPSHIEGYSSPVDIAKELGISATTIREHLKKLHKEGKIDAKQIRDRNNGCITWVYKD